LLAACVASIAAACADEERGAADDRAAIAALDAERLSGGDATVADATVGAYGNVSPNLGPERRDIFFLGNSVFNASWVTAPASAEGFDGLGPLFNVASCSGCHFKDGRGAPPEPGEPFRGLLLRLSVPGQDAHGGPVGDPTYGGQLGQNSVLSVPAEGTPSIAYEEIAGAYDDGTTYSLRRPTYRIDDLGYGPMDPAVMISPRVAPAMIGLGLLEAVPEADLLALEDPNDRDGDGISGHANRVWDVRKGALALGRFGWKAGQPTVEQQSAGAFNGDMGITTSMFPDEDCAGNETACRAAPSGGKPEINDQKLGWVVSYSRTLAVPERRAWTDPEVRRGKALFEAAKCQSCHVETLHTGPFAPAPELAGQTIRPFTDLLLHDMGEGLSDHRPDYAAEGNEWRTPPLWGIGLVKTVNKHDYLLHDGRARGLAEAILWHDGEAAPSRKAFQAMPAVDRQALLRFLSSLLRLWVLS
jgi:CxxC motif-containing protein (DUF1111 family)